MSEQREPAVEISHLAKSYRRGDQTVPVLTDITFNIAAGDFVALMGPSGSGKSTLLNLIAGIDKPDSGMLRVGGIGRDRLDAQEIEQPADAVVDIGIDAGADLAQQIGVPVDVADGVDAGLIALVMFEVAGLADNTPEEVAHLPLSPPATVNG